MSDPTTCPIERLINLAKQFGERAAELEGDGGMLGRVRERHIEDAHLLRLAAAELWLRRRGKYVRDKTWCLCEDAPQLPNSLPVNVFYELEGGIRFGGCITTVRYKDEAEAWAAAIEAVAKCLAEGTIEP